MAVIVPDTPANNAAPIDGQKQSYSAAVVGLVPAASPTDIFTLTGSATKTVRVTRIGITGTTDSPVPVALNVVLLRRSAADTGGTSSSSPTPVPHDSTNAAVSATVLAYTANPTGLGALVGTALRNQKLTLTLATYTATDFPSPPGIVWDFGSRPSQDIVLRGITQVLAVNLNGVSVVGNALLDIDIEWTEES